MSTRGRSGARRPGARRSSVKRGAARRPHAGASASAVTNGSTASASFRAGAAHGVSAADAIAGIPDTLREELLGRFNDVVLQYRRGHWESAILNAGKFCEVVYTIIRGRADRAYPPLAEKPPNMVRACQQLEQAGDAGLPRALRIQIPRCLLSVYEIRGNRGTGHAGAEINPNHMDAEYALHACQWMLGDLVRAFHQLDPNVARQVVEALTERMVPLIWDVGNGVKRVLDPSMDACERVLALLYATPSPVDQAVLRGWSEYKHPTRFKEEILADLHARALVHFDRAAGMVVISPIGQQVVERELLRDRVLS